MIAEWVVENLFWPSKAFQAEAQGLQLRRCYMSADDDEDGDLDLGPTSKRSAAAPADGLDEEEEEALGDDDLPEEL